MATVTFGRVLQGVVMGTVDVETFAGHGEQSPFDGSR
jgi:hypothetical protein